MPVDNSEKLRVSYLIKRVELLVRTRLEAALSDLGLTAGQYAALSLLSAMPEASSAQLSRAIGVTPQTIAETILTFERNDLIRREPSREHKRVLAISLTAKGRALLKQCEARATGAEGELFASLAPRDLQRFRSHLQAILQDDAG